MAWRSPLSIYPYEDSHPDRQIPENLGTSAVCVCVCVAAMLRPEDINRARRYSLEVDRYRTFWSDMAWFKVPRYVSCGVDSEQDGSPLPPHPQRAFGP